MFALTASPLAFAAGGDCPATFDSDDCDIGGGVNACTTGTDAGVDFIRCDLGAAGSDSTATVVRAYNGASRFSAWGTYGSTSTKFCCAYTDTVGGYADIKIQGSDFPDTLKYNYNNTHDLSAYNASTLYGSIDGGEGSDTIVGSNTNAASYVESLYGGPSCVATGDDTINGGAGDDHLYGECGDDTLIGGTGADTMSGGVGVDILLGGDGDDIMDGDGGNDAESGGDGDDIMDGGTGSAAAGTDALCGELNTGAGDELHASAGDSDKLWGAHTDDTLVCVDSSTQYDGVSSYTSNCTGTVLTTRPAACP